MVRMRKKSKRFSITENYIITGHVRFISWQFIISAIIRSSSVNMALLTLLLNISNVFGKYLV